MIVMQNLVYGYNSSLPFIIRIKTDNAGTSATNQFTLPLQNIAGLTYDYFVDWGDGEFTSHNTSVNVIHTYPSAGTYEIRIYGKFEKIYFNNAGDKLKLLQVLQWGDNYGKFGNQNNAFFGCLNLYSIADDCDVINAFVTNGQSMFYGNSLTSLPSGMTLGALTNGHSMFRDNSLTSAEYTSMTQITDMFGMFRNNPDFTGPINVGSQELISIVGFIWGTKFNQDISTWNFNFNCDFAQVNFNPGLMSNSGSYFSNENWGKLLIKVNTQCGAGTGRTTRKAINAGSGTKYPSWAASARAALVADGWDVRDGGAE